MLDQIPYITNKYIVSANVFHVVYKLLYCFQIDASLAPLRHPLTLLVATDFVINQLCLSQHTVMGASAVGLCMRALAPRAPFSTSPWSSFPGFMGHANNILEWKSQTWQKAGLRVSAGERREAREGKGLGGVKGKHPEMVNNQKVDF